MRARVLNGVAGAGGTYSEPHEWPAAGARTGFEALEQSVLVCPRGASVSRSTGAAEEVLFVLEGSGTLALDGSSYPIGPEAGAYLAPAEEYELRAETLMRVVSVRVPDPEAPASCGISEREVVRRLADQEPGAATTDRSFRILAGPESGLRSATHFVGYIPTVRAPEHFHLYDEVIYVIDGHGAMHLPEGTESLAAGSCIQLPARTVHCLENTGDSVMRIVAAFRPAGSPAAAYYPDGTPAYPDTPAITTT